MHLDRLRFFLSITLITLFFATAISVLFFSFGYRFNFERGIFIHTGSITIKSNPKDVRILIDGKIVPPGIVNIINQSYHITGLRPGEHFLRLEADGYRPWEKKVTIQSGVSTEFWNILLPKEEYPVTELATGSFRKMFPSPEQRYLALVGNEGGTAIVDILEKSSGILSRTASVPGYRFDAERLENMEWTEDGSKLLLPLRNNDGVASLFIVNRETGELTGTETMLPKETALRSARWHPGNDGSFFALSGTELLLVRPDEDTEARRITVIETAVSAYDLSEKYIYLFDQETGIIRTLDIGSETSSEAKLLPGSFPRTAAMRQPVLNAYDEKRIVLYDSGGEGFLLNDAGALNPDIIRLGGNIRNAQFSNDGKKLLFSDGNQISVIFPKDWDTQPIRKAGESIQLVRFSLPFSSVQWSRNYEHVLFSIGSDVRIAELDHRDRRQLETLLSFPGRTVLQILPSIDEYIVIILVSDETAGTSRVFSVPFPEKTGVFGN